MRVYKSASLWFRPARCRALKLSISVRSHHGDVPVVDCTAAEKTSDIRLVGGDILLFVIYRRIFSVSVFDLFKKIENDAASAPPSVPIRFIVCGLGNPGEKYLHTRHNAGFLAMNYISQKLNVPLTRSKFHSLCGEGMFGGTRVLLMKPQTFMNNSGEAVREAADFYKIPPENILIIFDDISLEPARLRVRRKGSDGGHNGIKSIIYHLGSDNFPRIKIGVGQKPHPDYDLVDWVLGKFSESDKKELFSRFETVYHACEDIVGGDIEKAMQRCSQK